MFSNGADVNLSKVYRSSSAASTELRIGELYRQAGSNAVFKFVEIGTGTPTIVEGIPLISGAAAGSAINGSAGAFNSAAANNLGVFQGIAQNTEAVTAADIGSGRTICVWAQVAGTNVNYIAADEAGEVGFDPNLASGDSEATEISLTVTERVGQDVGTVNTISTTDLLYIFDNTVTIGTDGSGLSVGSAVTPHGSGAGVASTVKAVYKDSGGSLRGVRFQANSGAYTLANNTHLSSGGTAASDVLQLAAPDYASLRGTY